LTDSLKYLYAVSLRITHPAQAPENFTSALGLKPHHFWTAGQNRRTPLGRPLPGIYKDNYWSHSFDTPEDADLPEFTSGILAMLSKHSSLFESISASGGRSALFIGFFTGAFNSSFSLSPELQSRCAALNLSLDFDIYTGGPGAA
jgi:hypothetical protein